MDNRPKPEILSPEDSAFWRQAYVDAFIDTSHAHYQDRIVTPRRFSDGFHITGYLRDLLRSRVRITEQRVSLEVSRHPEVFVMADDHSRDQVMDAPLWPYPAHSVARFQPQALLESLGALPEDLYVFDSSVSWTVVLTHSYDSKRRICRAAGIEE